MNMRPSDTRSCLIMQVIEAQSFWSWRLTTTCMSTMTGSALATISVTERGLAAYDVASNEAAVPDLCGAGRKHPCGGENLGAQG